MDSYSINNTINLASTGDNSMVSEKKHTASSVSSEPLDKYINELRSDLRNELKGISSIKWK